MDFSLRSFLRRAALGLACTVVLAGCVSTQERFEKGVRLEESGRYEQAADAFVRVLRKERHNDAARRRLQESGARVVAARLEEAEALEAAGRYEDAVGALVRLDAVRGRAAGVGVTLAVPEDYDAFRRSLDDGAVNELLIRAEREEEAGDFGAALRLYDRVEKRYALSAEERLDLDRSRVRAHLRWADADAAAGRFRSAFGRTEQALRFAPAGSAEAREVLALQEDAVREGTRYVAYLPVALAETADEPEQGFLYQLNEVLRHEHWGRPPLFLAPVEPAALHDALRRYRAGAGLSRQQATEVGRALDADFVVLTELTGFADTESAVREQRKAARTRGRNARDTSYVERQTSVKLHARLAYRLIDPRTGALLDEGTVEADASDKFTRGVYPGNPRDLDLSASARRLFDAEAHRKEEDELYGELLDALALDLGRRVQNELLRRIP